MAFINGFLRRASSSLILWRLPYQKEIIFAPNNKVKNISRQGGVVVVGRQFQPSIVRFLTGSTFVDKTTPPPPQTKAADEEETSRDDGLGGFVVTGGPRKGMLTLLRKGQDEIIRIDVKAYNNVMDYHDHDFIKYYHDINCESVDQMEIELVKSRNPEKVVDYNPCLHLQINIYYGHMYKKFIMFDVYALADSPDKVFTRRVYTSVLYGDGEKFKQAHLEEFDDFLKARGIEPGLMKSFFDSLNKPKDNLAVTYEEDLIR